MHRLLIGLVALGLLGIVAALYLQGLAHEYTIVLSGCLRMGLVLGAIWLAYEQVEGIVRRASPWVLGGVAIGLMVVVIRPRAILAVVPLLAGAIALHFLGRMLKP